MTLRTVGGTSLLIAALCSACATPYDPGHEYRPTTSSFEGLGTIIRTQDTGAALDVFAVHGMCDHGREWAQRTIDAIARSLNATASYAAPPNDEPLDEIKVHQARFEVDGRIVNVNAIVWSGLTRRAKGTLCYDQSVKSGSCVGRTDPKPYEYPWVRADVNAATKNWLLDECLSDMLVYQGQARLAIVQEMLRALLFARATSGRGAGSTSRTITDAAAASKAPLVVITESLGSKIVFDSLLYGKMSKDRDVGAAAAAIAAALTEVFMAANQLPALSLADTPISVRGTSLQPATEPRFPADPLGELAVARKSPKLRAIAFSDPNDVLSFTLLPYVERLPTGPNYEVVDVIVSNADTYFGKIEDPRRAHQEYLERAEVMRDIVCGRPRAWPCAAK